MSIKGRLITIRAVEKEDLPLLHEWANDEETNAMLGSWRFPSNMNDQLKWYEAINLNSLNQKYVIDVAGMGLIGATNLSEINWKDKNAFTGLLLDKAARGKGYATDAVMAIMRYAFEEMGLNRIDTTIIEYNTPSLNLYTKKCGWQIEGTQKRWYYRKNRFWDKHVLGITREEYTALINKNNYWNE